MRWKLLVVAAVFGSLLAGCASNGARQEPTGLHGFLILIGGGLDDDNKPVYERFIRLATPADPARPPRIVIATAASGNQDDAARGKIESIRAYCPSAQIDVVRRETPPDEAAAIIDQATAMFFTGGDQKRIVDAYRPPDATGRPTDNAAAEAMRRLLARGGVIAGTSAGDAMMSDPMFLTGRSAEALGIRSTRTRRADDDDPDEKRPLPPLGPQIGTGMGFLPWAIADSHFFERHRFGRLVAALESSGKRFGLGVGEDAAVEVELSTGRLTGLSVADSLLVDAEGIERDGLTRRNIRACVVSQGWTARFTELLQRPVPTPPGPPPGRIDEVPVAEPGQNRQLASWRFFVRAQQPGGPAQSLRLDGYQQTAWPDGRGWSIVEIGPILELAPSAPGAAEAPK